MRGGEGGMCAKEFTGRPLKTLTLREAHIEKRYPGAQKMRRRDRGAARDIYANECGEGRGGCRSSRAERRAPRASSACYGALLSVVRKQGVVCMNTSSRKRSQKLPDAPLRRLRADANLNTPLPGFAFVASTRSSSVVRSGRCTRAPARGFWRSARSIW